MFLFPFSRFTQLPSINNITVEDKFITVVVSQKMDNFLNVGIVDAKMKVGEDDGPVMRFQIVQGFIKL